MRNSWRTISSDATVLKTARKAAFSLIEVVIVLIVMWLLVTVLFQVYHTITTVSARVRLQKDIGDVMVTTNIVLQNIFDTHTVDYNALSGMNRAGTPWVLTTLPLRDALSSPVTLAIQSGTMMMTSVSGGITQTVQLIGGNIILEPWHFQVYPLVDPISAGNFNTIAKPGVRVAGRLHPANGAGVSFSFQTFYWFLSQ